MGQVNHQVSRVRRATTQPGQTHLNSGSCDLRVLRFYLVVLVLVIVIEDIENTTMCHHKKSIEKREKLLDATRVVFPVDYDYDYEHDYEHDRRHGILDFSTIGCVSPDDSSGNRAWRSRDHI